MKPVIITSGEPAGIGPDILLGLSMRKLPVPIVAIVDRDLLAARSKQLGINTSFPDYNPKANESPAFAIKHLPLRAACNAGEPVAVNATYIADMIKQAVNACLDHEFSALVTAPVNKAIMNESGIHFSGHTELLAELTKVGQSVMLMTNKHLKVALLTTHIPLADVSQHVTETKLTRCIEIIDADLKNKFGLNKPRILVCGLNPHAGENGHLGKEEINVIRPTLEKLRARGFELIGPVSADTAFTPSRLKNVDIVLAMYHDQGLPVIKAQEFGKTVNVTLGLPIIRTSVDHGTAFELAGTGKADDNSLYAAVLTAVEMARNDTHS